MKRCTKCGIEKPHSGFYQSQSMATKRSSKHDGYKPMCKQCYAERAKQWAANNKEKRLEIAKRWAEQNPEKRAESLKKYNSKAESKKRHKEWRKENIVGYLANRRKTDSMFAFKVKIRSTIYKSITKMGYTKKSRSREVLGCSWEFLKGYLEAKFQPGMTWDNRGQWEVDHIVPISSAVTEDDVIRLNHYTNLQPLWASDNRSKGAKMDWQPEEP